jgi:hypothetical protein
MKKLLFSALLFALTTSAQAGDCSFYVSKCPDGVAYQECSDSINQRVARRLEAKGFVQVESRQEASYLLTSSMSCSEEQGPINGWFAETLFGRGDCDGWFVLENVLSPGQNIHGSVAEHTGIKSRAGVIRKMTESAECGP